MVEIKKQFIAGAVCTQCQAMDKIQLIKESEQGETQCSYICVACGYTRSDSEFEITDPDVSPVQLVQPKKN
ncbi:MAG: YheV family putative metal-binding protein [Pseudomonadales bacterium]|nr:YheV family putative metal-binding protein [Pseudomonadales bacterium]